MLPIDDKSRTNSVQYSFLENLRETSLELSLVNCGKKITHRPESYDDETQTYLLYFVLGGQGRWTIDNQTRVLKTGDSLLIHPHTDYSYQTDTEETCSLVWIGFKGILSEKILLQAGFSHTSPLRNFSDTIMISSYIDRIMQYSQLTLSNDLKRLSILTDFMAYLIDTHSLEKPATQLLTTDYSQNIYVNHAIEHIRASYSQNISVQSIANFIGISRTHLNNCFQKELGVSVQKFLIDFRLYQAAFQLTSTTLQVQEIAERIGYTDPLTFSKAFKKKFHLSPRDYRLEQSQSSN